MICPEFVNNTLSSCVPLVAISNTDPSPDEALLAFKKLSKTGSNIDNLVATLKKWSTGRDELFDAALVGKQIGEARKL